MNESLKMMSYIFMSKLEVIVAPAKGFRPVEIVS